MLFIYSLTFLTETIFICNLFQPSYWAATNFFLMMCHAIDCGAILVIDILLMKNMIRKSKGFTCMKLLIIFVIVQITTLIIGIPTNIMYGNFWNEGYLYFILKAGTIGIFFGWYRILKTEKEFLLSHEEEGGPRK